MKVSNRGQVTIPVALRRRFGLRPGDEVDVVGAGDELRVVPRPGRGSRGEAVVAAMRGRASTSLSTDELMFLLRGR